MMRMQGEQVMRRADIFMGFAFLELMMMMERRKVAGIYRIS